MIRRLRIRFGRWLLRPLADQIVHHYSLTAEGHRTNGRLGMADNCEYIVLGARYVATYWPGEPLTTETF